MPSTTAAGTALKALRKGSGLTLQELAERAGASLTYLSRVENGLQKPSASYVENIITAVGELIEEDHS